MCVRAKRTGPRAQGGACGLWARWAEGEEPERGPRGGLDPPKPAGPSSSARGPAGPWQGRERATAPSGLPHACTRGPGAACFGDARSGGLEAVPWGAWSVHVRALTGAGAASAIAARVPASAVAASPARAGGGGGGGGLGAGGVGHVSPAGQ